MIRLSCPKCKTTLNMDRGFAGGVCRCSNCGTLMTVPDKKNISKMQTERPETPNHNPQTSSSTTPPPPLAELLPQENHDDDTKQSVTTEGLTRLAILVSVMLVLMVIAIVIFLTAIYD